MESFDFNNLNPLRSGRGTSGRTVRHLRPVAGAAYVRRWLRASPGFPGLDAPASGGAGETPPLALQVIESREERAAVHAMFTVVALEAGLNFMMPLYIQIVQGRTPLDTAIAMMPFNLTVFFAAMLIVHFYDALTPRQIGRLGFVLCAIALYGSPLWSTVTGKPSR